jgi:8-oxo-dGTP pyrophosphatase MutT (NUDIX family)
MKLIDKIALILVSESRVLTARSYDKAAFYLPGGKRESGESDIDTLVREIKEELDATVISASAQHYGTFYAAADAKANDTIVKMSCYIAEIHGVVSPSSEIAEVKWLEYADIELVSAVTRIIFYDLHHHGIIT